MKDFVLSVMDFGLEPASEAGVLKALGQIADQKTGFARVSVGALAWPARLSKRTVERALVKLTAADRAQLVLVIEPPKPGPGSAGIYRVHWERIALVADAYRTARRRIHAGAAGALEAAGLAMQPACPERCADVMTCLHKALTREGEYGAAREISGLMGQLDAEMEAWPGRVLRAVEKRGGNTDTVSRITDTVSRNTDTVSASPTPPNKDSSPQGISPYARGHAREPSLAEGGAEAAEGRFGGAFRGQVGPSLTPALLAGMVGERRSSRSEILETLVGCQIIEIDDHLMIRAASAAQRDQLYAGKFAAQLVDFLQSSGRWTTFSITCREAS